MNENRTFENGVATFVVPNVRVKIYLPKDSGKNHGKLLAFASVNLGGVFAVNNVRIYNSEKGPFVTMPSTKGQNGKYRNICCPTTKEMRQALNAAVLGAYQQAMGAERLSTNGAVEENEETAPHSVPDQQAKRTEDEGTQ